MKPGKPYIENFLKPRIIEINRHLRDHAKARDKYQEQAENVTRAMLNLGLEREALMNELKEYGEE